MNRFLKDLLAASLCALALTACKEAGRTATEIPHDSVITLAEPDMTLGTPLMQSLSDRASRREFSDTPLSLEELSSLLWAANGVNREDGRRTAPSAVNAQDIDIYVCLEWGAYLYDAAGKRLVRVSEEDLRPAVYGRQPMDAPVFLVLVGDLSRYPEGLAARRSTVESFACMDAGYVSGNIGLYCAAASLATVPRASMDKEALARALDLPDTRIPLLNNPVGHIK